MFRVQSSRGARVVTEDDTDAAAAAFTYFHKISI